MQHLHRQLCAQAPLKDIQTIFLEQQSPSVNGGCVGFKSFQTRFNTSNPKLPMDSIIQTGVLQHEHPTRAHEKQNVGRISHLRPTVTPEPRRFPSLSSQRMHDALPPGDSFSPPCVSSDNVRVWWWWWYFIIK